MNKHEPTRDKLKHCPWCGSEPERGTTTIGSGWHWVGCCNNECEVRPTAIKPTAEEAKDAWEDRTIDRRESPINLSPLRGDSNDD